VGCGKSTTVRVVAAELGYEVVEYLPSTPTLWAELQHQVRSRVTGGSGLRSEPLTLR